MTNRLLYEQRPKYSAKKCFWSYFLSSISIIFFIEGIFAFFAYSINASIPFGIERKTFYALLFSQIILVLFLVLFTVKKQLENYSSCVYKFYENRIEIHTRSKIVKLKYSAIKKVEVDSIQLVSGVPLNLGEGTHNIKIIPMMQHGRKSESKYCYHDFVYRLLRIEHAQVFCNQINNLIFDYCNKTNKGNYDEQ